MPAAYKAHPQQRQFTKAWYELGSRKDPGEQSAFHAAWVHTYQWKTCVRSCSGTGRGVHVTKKELSLLTKGLCFVICQTTKQPTLNPNKKDPEKKRQKTHGCNDKVGATLACISSCRDTAAHLHHNTSLLQDKERYLNCAAAILHIYVFPPSLRVLVQACTQRNSNVQAQADRRS